ncbi:MAG: type II toxin-antitoxin system HicA family toxin [Bacteroidetes bacterium]|nr:type II toxin-antitoxin system HicA family toxin [Bacteroidota bacterium]
MSRLPIVDAKTFEKILLRLGFVPIRQKGSHVFYRHPDGRFTTLPHHKGNDIGRSLTRMILREINISVEEFTKLLNEL